jgi:hypothetical protein
LVFDYRRVGKEWTNYQGEEMIAELIRKLKEDHYRCGDDFHSCPLSGKCENDQAEGCTCGADEKNKKLEEIAVIVEEYEKTLERIASCDSHFPGDYLAQKLLTRTEAFLSPWMKECIKKK